MLPPQERFLVVTSQQELSIRHRECVCVLLAPLGWVHANLPHCFGVSGFPALPNKAFFCISFCVQNYFAFASFHHPTSIPDIRGDGNVFVFLLHWGLQAGFSMFGKATPLSLNPILTNVWDHRIDQPLAVLIPALTFKGHYLQTVLVQQETNPQ